MGLIKAAKDALGGLMADQWREYFYCTSLNSVTLMTKGEKQVTKGRNSNTKGNDNIISNGSVISVNAGQCMIIVDQGKIAEFCAEPGEFVYDASTEPSLLYGNLGENIKKTFSQFGRRFTFGGNTAKDQRVYYINTKEIMNNLYGTPNPIPFHFVARNTGFELETTVKCNGQYTFRIIDPILFYTNVAGNVEEDYNKNDTLSGMMKAELLTKLPMALSKIAAEGVLPYQVPMHMEEITDSLKEGLSVQWAQTRGIEVVSMTMAAPIVPQQDLDKINKWNDTAVLTNAGMAAARQTEAYTKALENMGNGGDGEGGNSSAVNGAMGMMGMAMMQNMMNNGMGSLFGTPQPGQAQQPQPMKPASTVAEGAVLGWTCSCGKQDNRGKFCQECGLPKPALDGWTCACGHVNQGKFCQECGRKKPEGAPLYRCDKCGWEPEDPTKPPKFCPECGDVFDDNDRM